MQAFFLCHVLCGAGGDETIQLFIQFGISGRIEAVFVVPVLVEGAVPAQKAVRPDEDSVSFEIMRGIVG